VASSVALSGVVRRTRGQRHGKSAAEPDPVTVNGRRTSVQLYELADERQAEAPVTPLDRFEARCSLDEIKRAGQGRE
jgi:hypothetical protein